MQELSNPWRRMNVGNPLLASVEEKWVTVTLPVLLVDLLTGTSVERKLRSKFIAAGSVNRSAIGFIVEGSVKDTTLTAVKSNKKRAIIDFWELTKITTSWLSF